MLPHLATTNAARDNDTLYSISNQRTRPVLSIGTLCYTLPVDIIGRIFRGTPSVRILPFLRSSPEGCLHPRLLLRLLALEVVRFIGAWAAAQQRHAAQRALSQRRQEPSQLEALHSTPGTSA